MGDTLLRFGRIAILAGLLSLDACGDGDGEAARDPTPSSATAVAPESVMSVPAAEPEPAPTPAPANQRTPPPPPEAGSAQVEGACSRVAACCRAFHSASHAPTTLCDGYDTSMPTQPNPAMDPRCVPTLDGFRRSFERMGSEIPEACR